jgi:hypothetical protein
VRTPSAGERIEHRVSKKSADGCCIRPSAITTPAGSGGYVLPATVPEIMAGTCSDHRHPRQCVLDT